MSLISLSSMFKQSSGRTQRTKGFKVKHALQVFVLVSVCIWLLYQVKHYHDKKRALEESNTKISTVVEDSHSDVLRFGRKDLPQVAVETNLGSETHNDDEGNEEAEEEAENRLQEGDEEEAKDAIEDEIDENDQEEEGEGPDEEGEHNEEAQDDEEKEGQSDEQGLSANEEQDNTEANIQEAREEHYKGDDASSAVVRDAEMTESKSRNNIEEQIKNVENDLVVNNKTTGAEDGLKVDESGALVETNEIRLFNDTSTNHTKHDESGAPVEKSEIDLSNDTSMNNTSYLDREHETEVQENLILTEHDNQVENQANSTAEPRFALTRIQNNSTNFSNSENSSSSFQISGQDQTWARGVATGAWKVYNTSDNGSPKSEKILIERTVNSDSTDEGEKLEENSSTSSTNNDDDNASKGHNAVQADSNDPLAKVDTVTEEENDARIDLSTLPETETKAKVEEFAAE